MADGRGRDLAIYAKWKGRGSVAGGRWVARKEVDGSVGDRGSQEEKRSRSEETERGTKDAAAPQAL